MPPLSNPRHERFAQALLEGCSADEAIVKAGYSENRGNASRLKAKESISMRLAELQAAAAKASTVSVQSLLSELEEARQKATSLSQLSAVVRAVEAKARVSGLLTQKIEVSTHMQELDSARTPEEIATVLARDIAEDKGITLTADEMTGFKEHLVSCLNSISHYLAACAAKPVPQVVDVQAMEVVRDNDRRRLGLRRISNA